MASSQSHSLYYVLETFFQLFLFFHPPFSVLYSILSNKMAFTTIAAAADIAAVVVVIVVLVSLWKFTAKMVFRSLTREHSLTRFHHSFVVCSLTNKIIFHFQQFSFALCLSSLFLIEGKKIKHTGFPTIHSALYMFAIFFLPCRFWFFSFIFGYCVENVFFASPSENKKNVHAHTI